MPLVVFCSLLLCWVLWEIVCEWFFIYELKYISSWKTPNSSTKYRLAKEYRARDSPASMLQQTK